MEEKQIKIIDVVVFIKALISFVKRKISILGLVSIIFALLGFFAFAPKDNYVAKTSIMMTGGVGQGGGILSLASSFGLDKQQGVTFEKYKGVATSGEILNRSLLSLVTVNNKKSFLADHLMDHFSLRKAWENRKNLAFVDFSIENSSRDTVLSHISKLIGPSITVSENTEELTVIKTTSNNEELAYVLNEVLMKETLAFFKKTAVQEDRYSKSVIEIKLDSIQKELYGVEQLYAKLKDESFKMVKTKGYIEILRAERNMKILTQMMGDAIKQNEIFSIKIMNNQPAIQVVDTPFLPLQNLKKSKITITVIFGILGFIIGLIALKGCEYYQTIIKQLNNK